MVEIAEGRADALAGLAASSRRVAAADMTSLPAAARFVFRGREGAIEPAGRAFGVGLPRAACRFAEADGRLAAWLGPDEWLLVAPGADAGPIAAAIEAETAAVPHSLVDVGQRQVAIEVSGPAAATVINAGCPLDLSPEAFPAGMAARTVLAKAEIVLFRTAPETFRIEVWRSFAAYVWQSLDEARREFV